DRSVARRRDPGRHCGRLVEAARLDQVEMSSRYCMFVLLPDRRTAGREIDSRMVFSLVMPGRRILLPLPDRDFDVTEVAVPWRLLTRAGHQVVFATERGGSAPAADPLLMSGVVFGRLGAAPE